MFAIDHVIVTVDDLDAAADRLWSEHGLASITGGRHPGHGTGNRIVPLGENYLELMAVVDPSEAAGSPLGRWVTRMAGAALAPAALCLRTGDIGGIATILGEEPLAMTRETPDGRVLAWSLAGLSGMLGPLNLPFFIQWRGGDADHPARAAADHAVLPAGITAVAIGPPGSTLDEVVALTPGVAVAAESPGVHAVTIATDRGEIVLARP